MILLIAFAPGSRGFKLGTWLIEQKIVAAQSYNNSKNKETYHTFVPFYNDILFFFNNNSKKIFNKVNNLLFDSSTTTEDLTKILATSAYLPITGQLSLVLTHHPTCSGLYKLSQALNSQVIKITFDNYAQARSACMRKFKLDNVDPPTGWHLEQHLEKWYYPFIGCNDFAINVTTEQVNNLDLNFLKQVIKGN